MNNYNDFIQSLFHNKKYLIKIIVIIICLIYIISPLDFINDFIPVGRIDDLIVLIICMFVTGTLFFQIKYDNYEHLRMLFRKEFADIDDKFSSLLKTIHSDDKFDFYNKEALNVFKEMLKVYSNIIEAEKRLEKLEELKNKLLPTLENEDNNPRAKEGIEKSKKLIARIDKEREELDKYIVKAREEIKLTGLDFIHVTTELELSKGSEQLVDPVILSSRSQSLSYIASNLPVTTGLMAEKS